MIREIRGRAPVSYGEAPSTVADEHGVAEGESGMRWIIAAVALGAGLWWIASSDEEAMRTCQERHSFDTCYYALHR